MNQKISDEKNLILKLLNYKFSFFIVFIIIVFVSTINALMPFMLKITIDDIVSTNVKTIGEYNNYNDITSFDFDGKNYSKLSIHYRSPDAYRYYINYDEFNYLLPDFINLAQDYKINISNGVHILTTFGDSYVIEPVGNEFVEKEEVNNTKILKIISMFFLVLILISFILSYFQMLIMAFISNRIVFNMRNEFFNKLLYSDLKSIYKIPIGKVVTRITDDMENIKKFYRDILPFAMKDITIVIAILIMMFLLDFVMASIFFVGVILFSIIVLIFRSSITSIQKDIRNKYAQMISKLLDSIVGMNIIQIFAAKDFFSKDFKKSLDSYWEPKKQRLTLFSFFRPITDMLQNISILLIIFYSVNKILNYEIEIGVMVAFVSYSALLYKPINDFSQKYLEYQTAIVSAERIMNLHRITNKLEETELPSSKANINGSIEFKNVYFSYKENSNNILKDINFKISDGQKIAIVGPLNSGKSTIVNLIARFYDVNSGTIKINGINIKDYLLKDIRTSISMVFQDPYIFSQSVYDNIRMYNHELTNEDIEKVCKKIGAEEFILKLYKGYEHVLHESGKELSLGQKQLISLARAICSKSRIIIFDEAFSNLDSEVEESIQDLLDSLEYECTVIRITNNLLNIRDLDLILVLDSGQLVEQGTHRELLKNKSFYYKMYNLQYNTEEE